MIPWLEIRRKIMHVYPIAIPIGYHYLSKSKVVLILLPIFAFYLAFDLLRHYHKGFGELFDRVITSRFLRDRERKGLIGSTYFLIGTLLTILFFPKDVAIVSLYILIISDASAAIVGSGWGKIYLFREKTLEGSIAFFLSGMVIVALTMKSNIVWGGVAVLGATLVELLPLKLDDNLTIPLVAAGIMHIGL
jgi:dolichol kinase